MSFQLKRLLKFARTITLCNTNDTILQATSATTFIKSKSIDRYRQRFFSMVQKTDGLRSKQFVQPSG